MSSELVEAARHARNNAYAPYSNYKVGAAVRSADGFIFSGSNVENVSYGLTLCAERVAIAQMVSAGHHQLSAIALVTADGAMPCGMCLQTMLEFAVDPSSVFICCAAGDDTDREYILKDLIPYGFSSKSVNRAEPFGL